MCLWNSSLGREEIIRKQVHLWFPCLDLRCHEWSYFRKKNGQTSKYHVHSRGGYHDAPVDDDSNGSHTDRCRNKIIRSDPQTVMQHHRLGQTFLASSFSWIPCKLIMIDWCSLPSAVVLLFFLSVEWKLCVCLILTPDSWLLDCIIVKSWISLKSL